MLTELLSESTLTNSHTVDETYAEDSNAGNDNDNKSSSEPTNENEAAQRLVILTA